MECVEAAFIRKEMAMKTTQPCLLVDDLWSVSVPNGASCDDFVDEFLNFPNVEEEAEEEEKQLLGVEEEETIQVAVEVEREMEVVVPGAEQVKPNSNITLSVVNSPPEQETTHEDDNSSSFTDEFCSVSQADDGLASLEWLSHFVEDSNSEYSAPFPVGVLPEKHMKDSQNRSEPEKDSPCFKSLVPGKARSKRRSTGIWVSPLGLTMPLTESSSSSTASSSSSSSCPWLTSLSGPVYLEPVSSEKPWVKSQKKKTTCDPDNNVKQQLRRCSHCGVTKTPQWRAGPLGAKTLCNACGVRYKSGRLLPEYRPASSPTFSSKLHSNHHRKVLEMRKKKEVLGGQLQYDMAPSVVPSFEGLIA